MLAIIKSVKAFGLFGVLFIVSAYFLLYANLSYTNQKYRVHETSSYPSTGVLLRSTLLEISDGVNISNSSDDSSKNITDAVNPLSSISKPQPNTTVSKKTKKKKKKKKKKLNILKEIMLRSDSEVESDLKQTYNLNDLTSAPNCSNWNDTVMPPYTRLCEQKNVGKHPVITLFTTMHYSIKDFNILNNTLRLWSQLGPKVRRILFVSSPHVERHVIKGACDADWNVMTAPLCDKNNLPVLKAMFMAAQQVHESDFYGYANGDILFDESLLKTLEFIKKKFLHLFDKTLFVGSRTNIKLQVNQTITDLKELRVLSQNGTDGWVAAIDYFISSRNGYDWENIPKVVIGRVAYDNWMIRHAVQEKFAVFDITNTSLSAHQMGSGKYYGSHHKRDVGINNALVGYFDFTKGLITCAQLKTKLEDNSIRLKKRIKYGMCGYGNWGKRKISRYGDEIEADYEPGMKL